MRRIFLFLLAALLCSMCSFLNIGSKTSPITQTAKSATASTPQLTRTLKITRIIKTATPTYTNVPENTATVVPNYSVGCPFGYKRIEGYSMNICLANEWEGGYGNALDPVLKRIGERGGDSIFLSLFLRSYKNDFNFVGYDFKEIAPQVNFLIIASERANKSLNDYVSIGCEEMKSKPDNSNKIECLSTKIRKLGKEDVGVVSTKGLLLMQVETYMIAYYIIRQDYVWIIQFVATEDVYFRSLPKYETALRSFNTTLE